MRHLMRTLAERVREAAGDRQPRGQSLLIIAVGFIGLAVMVGMAIDGGILFIAQAHLRRAVDAAAVAAATQMRVGQTPEGIQRFANQFIRMNGVDPTTVIVSLYDYNNDPSGALGQMATDCHRNGPNVIDPAYDRYGLCGVPQRKLIRVEGRTAAQFAFMPLMGIFSTTVTADAVAESASVDAVIVLDTSNSMGDETNRNDGSPLGVDTPTAVADCNDVALTDPKNVIGNCRPLMDAKEAAKAFVRRLYPNYDRVAIINFDFKARPVIITDTRSNIAYTSPFAYVRTIRNPAPDGSNKGSGPCPPAPDNECDDDPALAGSQSTGLYQALDSVKLYYDRRPWLDTNVPGFPAGATPSANDWMLNWGKWNPLDYRCNWATWGTASCPGHPLGAKGTPDPNGDYSFLSTCTSCGIRVAGNFLKLNGRPSALWVIVFLSDGGVNASDVPDIAINDAFFAPGLDPTKYPNGYCGIITTTVALTNPVSLWSDRCVSKPFSATTRICGPYHESQANCPPLATYVGPNSPPYDSLDYARDMIDTAALQVNCVSGPGEDCLANNGGTSLKYNKAEHPRGSTGPAGANVAIYAIGLGKYVASGDAQALLRYMAAVGDDGDRATDPCGGVGNATSCGNYYYAAQGAELKSVFEDIAKRVFTRLSK